MNFASFVILAIIVVALIAAARYSLKHHTSCADCTGSCSSSSSCTKQPSAENKELFRQQRLDNLWEDTIKS